MIKGALTAMVTPFKSGAVDTESLSAMIEAQITGGIDGLVPCGTTGESATLSHEEHSHVIELTIEQAAGRVPVVAGTGSNSTDETLMLTKGAEKAGANAALLITPYYNKPSQQGLFEHYKKISEAVDLPLFLYNVPSRTGLNMLPETIARLSEFENIIGVKEATGDLAQVSDVIEYSTEDFIILSGDDAVTLPMLTIGAHGVISVTSNIAPKEMALMVSRYFAGDLAGARELHYRLSALHRAMFLETNPLPVKTALAVMGRCAEEFRLPLVTMEESKRGELVAALTEYGFELSN
ncbi:MAG: 4-hydroxy-tetrahydrodipicolinate synthase [Proteobacteria bacterium]|nr:4-hydroxy-tetrahydrodipicolinate synthase [Pseudomonadota bacterium]